MVVQSAHPKQVMVLIDVTVVVHNRKHGITGRKPVHVNNSHKLVVALDHEPLAGHCARAVADHAPDVLDYVA